MTAGAAGPAGGTASAQPADPAHPVRPVSEADRTWATLGSELTPAKSLQRMDTATDRVVRTVTIIGTLLGGFGVFGATKPTVSGRPGGSPSAPWCAQRRQWPARWPRRS